MDYVLEKLEGLPVDELLIITGHLKDQVEQYVADRLSCLRGYVESSGATSLMN